MIAFLLAAALAAPPPSDAVDASAKAFANLEAMYQQSCTVRAYGSFDDVCDSLRKQMKEAEKRQRKARARERVRDQGPVRDEAKAAAPAPGPS